MPKPAANVEIRLVNTDEWNLSPAGTAMRFRYWAHIRLEDDSKADLQQRTVFVELTSEPTPCSEVYFGKMYFVAPTAPHDSLKAGGRFELCVGPIVKARGVITSLATVEFGKGSAR